MFIPVLYFTCFDNKEHNSFIDGIYSYFCRNLFQRFSIATIQIIMTVAGKHNFVTQDVDSILNFTF